MASTRLICFLMLCTVGLSATPGIAQTQKIPTAAQESFPTPANRIESLLSQRFGYVNDEGIRVGKGGRVISERNVFDMGCNSAQSGPRVIRYVLPAEIPLGILYSDGDIVSKESSTCAYTLDEGFISAPAPKPFSTPYAYELLKSREEILKFVGIPR